MTEIKKYLCVKCGQEHEEWPSLAYISPTSYNNLSENDKQNIAFLDSDFCQIRYPDQTDNFIRCTLTLKVIDYCENLEYGLWVSLSDTSFQDYSENYTKENYETNYFGWFSNYLPDYEDTLNIPTTVFTRTENKRPEIIPYRDYAHSIVRDYYNGITKVEAERRINEMLKSTGQI